MKKIPAFFIIASFLFLLWGCPDGIHKKYNYDAYFPEHPVNLADVNSIYDDYNSILPEYNFGKLLIFSSNRYTQGGTFDLVHDNFHVNWDMETSQLTVNNEQSNENDHYIVEMMSKIHWEGNEFGPYAIGFDTMIDNSYNRMNLLAYSTNNDQNTYHEEYILHITRHEDNKADSIEGPFILSFLVTNPRQQYISFYGKNVQTIDDYSVNPNQFTCMYFDADENGKADIYKIDIPQNKSFLEFLSDTVIYPKTKIEALSSAADDRCPFVNGNFMVFTSDRSGGFGGYDLYYSRFDGETWSEPVNFGDKINTKYNEFRPVAIQVSGFKNDVMIFSSDRPDSKGGYDLYYVGIDKIVPANIIED